MEDLINTGNRTLYLIVLLSAVPVGVATIVGLAVGLFQTVTQLQEQTLPYGVKLLAVVLSVVLLMGWFGSELLTFGNHALDLAISSDDEERR